MNPRGGTELQMEMLYKHCPKELLDKTQICTSIPGKVPIDPNKLNILWQKNSYDQSNLQEFFNNPFKHSDYDWYVFNSHWNYEKFRMAFNIPQEKSIVIKNGCTNFPERKPYIKGQPIKIIHHSTPWRGLNVLLAAMQLVKNPLITLDVYSSTKVYGSEFSQAHEATYQPLFDQAKSLPNVNYIGYVPNEQILEKITDYQMFVYPSIFEETFCISALECMSAGLHVITTNFGALFETCSEWPVYVNYDSNVENLARATAHAIETAATYLHEQPVQDHLAEQQKLFKKFYSWKKKGSEWENFLKGAIHAKGL